MRVALFSDIHGNTPGLRAILAHLEEQGGADLYYSLGDMLGGGPGSDDLIELLLEHDVHMIHGNHEELYIDPDTWLQKIPPEWLDWARRTADWIQGQLSASYWTMLAKLPASATFEMEAQHRLFLCHADPKDAWAKMCAPGAPRERLQAAFGGLDAQLVAYGHYHGHHVMRLDNKYLVNVASVGVRRDGLSAYTLIENLDGQLVIRQFQVPYDTVEETRLTQLRGVPQP